jgi:pimeloyl-ACP methyl ester carboxylesterase
VDQGCGLRSSFLVSRRKAVVLSLDGDGGGELYGMLGRIRCPTLVMHGQASWVMDAAEAAALRAAIPDCSLRAFPGAHHFFLAQPPAVGAALRSFLDEDRVMRR